MDLSGLHPLMLFLMGVLFVGHVSSTFTEMVYSGTNVSLLCSNMLKEPSYIAWFKQTDHSLPVCIVTQYVGANPADSIYLNGFQKNHIEMSVNKTFSTLRIISVDVSDSGTFYCGSFIRDHMKFYNQTQLVVVNATNQSKDNPANTDCETTEEMSISCHIFYTLTLILSGLVLFPTVFAIVVLIKLKKMKQKGDAKHSKNKKMKKRLQHKEQEEDLNYAALNLDKKSRRPVRSMRTVEPNVVYAATR